MQTSGFSSNCSREQNALDYVPYWRPSESVDSICRLQKYQNTTAQHINDIHREVDRTAIAQRILRYSGRKLFRNWAPHHSMMIIPPNGLYAIVAQCIIFPFHSYDHSQSPERSSFISLLNFLTNGFFDCCRSCRLRHSRTKSTNCDCHNWINGQAPEPNEAAESDEATKSE